MKIITCILSLFVAVNLLDVGNGTPLNTPPHISFNREWVLTEEEPVGTVVTRVQVHDEDGDHVNISIGGPSSSASPLGGTLFDGTSFFKIDPNNRVLLAKSLRGMAGKTFLVGIIASDGIAPKNRVDAKVSITKTKSALPRYIPSQPGLPSAFDPGPPPPLQDIHRNAFSGDVGPPLLHLDPFTVWDIGTEAPVGWEVTTVEAQDLSGTFLEFSLFPDDIVRIDPANGRVVVAATSLSEKVGDHIVEVKVSNKFDSISEHVTLRITIDKPFDHSSFAKSEEDPLPLSTPPPRTRLTSTTARSSSTSSLTTTTKQVLLVEKETENKSSSKEGQKTRNSALSWSAGILVLVLGVIIATACMGLIAWRCRKRIKLLGETKESSVLYSEKRGGISQVEQRDGGHRESIIDGIFSFVGVRKRAESNGYEEDVGVPPRVPNRESRSRKASNSAFEENQRDKWEFPRHKLRVLGILGEGCFGQVWKCEVTSLSGEEPAFVAVKTLKESAGASEAKDLFQELKVLKSLARHPNVVSLLGCCTEKEPVFIILEYMSGGKLQSFLRTSRAGHSYGNLHGISSSLTPRDLTIFALQVARGMDFLSKNGIIHRDLAARNVLIGKNKVCKVADFGFARDVANNHVYERKSDGRLPIRWMAPESLFDNIFTTKSDVWSFGILLWEIVTLGSTPYPGMSAAEVMRSVKDEHRMKKPDHCRREIYNIMYYCWDSDQKARPSFPELIKSLEELILTEVDYIQLDNFPDHTYYNFSSVSTSAELL